NYKIGCPLEEHSKLRLESNDRGVKRYRLYSSDDFYIMQDVDVVNGNIVSVRLTSSFNSSLDKNDFLKKYQIGGGLI
ncbi:hypothetical protein, partial [Ignatzschineria indica]|uniref:hypothetical protein n=1 Tax=Ignatzschineria indica TaxID=472583 RepID=UPI00362D97FF